MPGKCVLSEASAPCNKGHALAAIALAVGPVRAGVELESSPLCKSLTEAVEVFRIHRSLEGFLENKDVRPKGVLEFLYHERDFAVDDNSGPSPLKQLKVLDATRLLDDKDIFHTWRADTVNVGHKRIPETFTQALVGMAKSKSLGRRTFSRHHFLFQLLNVVEKQLDSAPLKEARIQEALETHRKKLFGGAWRKSQNQATSYAAALIDLVHNNLGDFKNLAVPAVYFKLKTIFPDFEFDLNATKTLDPQDADSLKKLVMQRRQQLIGKPVSQIFKILDLTEGFINVLRAKTLENRIPFILYNLMPEDIPEDLALRVWGEPVAEAFQDTAPEFQRLALANCIARQHFAQGTDATMQKSYPTLEELITPEFLYWGATAGRL
eukprot:Protomagalhaensia_wolfi_Nauph_80__1305@NODE_1779_length_1345_cov_15_556662_g1386_i0_p1_GENE_NODE_1779_length_1345_cov_15_556662_g1386_i0NODE_1779_length_1345_cov_15_556662_g1386_i0_p1_ORF_typecomplete_len379_score69_06_NODE_1779_length_1345_cov_15_556662_g1386_i0461182